MIKEYIERMRTSVMSPVRKPNSESMRFYFMTETRILPKEFSEALFIERTIVLKE